jgi:hypothetical protein
MPHASASWPTTKVHLFCKQGPCFHKRTAAVSSGYLGKVWWEGPCFHKLKIVQTLSTKWMAFNILRDTTRDHWIRPSVLQTYFRIVCLGWIIKNLLEFKKYLYLRLLRLCDVIRMIIDKSCINLHYSGFQKPLAFDHNAIQSWKIVSLKCLRASPMSL